MTLDNILDRILAQSGKYEEPMDVIVQESDIALSRFLKEKTENASNKIPTDDPNVMAFLQRAPLFNSPLFDIFSIDEEMVNELLGWTNISFHDFIDNHKKQYLKIAHDISKKKGKKAGAPLLYTCFNEVVLQEKTVSAQSGKKNKECIGSSKSGMVLSCTLVNPANQEYIGVLEADLMEYPETAGNFTQKYLSETAQKEIKTSLWKNVYGKIAAAAKKPQTTFLFVSEQPEMANVIFTDMARGNHQCLMRVNSPKSLDARCPFALAVKEWLEQHDTAEHRNVIQGKESERFKKILPCVSLTSRENELVNPTLELEISYGCLPKLEELFLLERAKDMELAEKAGKPSLPPITDLQPGELPIPATPMFYVSLLQTNCTNETAEPINWLLCTNRPVNSNADAINVLRNYSDRLIFDQTERAFKAAVSLECKYTLDFIGSARVGYLISAMPHLLEIQTSSFMNDALGLDETMFYASGEILEEILASQDKFFPLDTLRDFYLGIASAGGYKLKSRKQPSWKELWQGWGLLLQESLRVEAEEEGDFDNDDCDNDDFDD